MDVTVYAGGGDAPYLPFVKKGVGVIPSLRGANTYFCKYEN